MVGGALQIFYPVVTTNAYKTETTREPGDAAGFKQTLGRAPNSVAFVSSGITDEASTAAAIGTIPASSITPDADIESS